MAKQSSLINGKSANSRKFKKWKKEKDKNWGDSNLFSTKTKPKTQTPKDEKVETIPCPVAVSFMDAVHGGHCHQPMFFFSIVWYLHQLCWKLSVTCHINLQLLCLYKPSGEICLLRECVQLGMMQKIDSHPPQYQQQY